MKLAIWLKPSFANIRSDAELRAAASAVETERYLYCVPEIPAGS